MDDSPFQDQQHDRGHRWPGQQVPGRSASAGGSSEDQGPEHQQNEAPAAPNRVDARIETWKTWWHRTRVLWPTDAQWVVVEAKLKSATRSAGATVEPNEP